MQFTKVQVVSALVVGLGLTACSGSVSPNDESKADDGGGHGGNGGEDGVGGSAGEAPGWSGGSNGGGPPPVDVCADHVPKLSGVHLTRLTNTQYVNTVRDLFPGVSLPQLDLPVETRRRDGFLNQGEAQNPTTFVRYWANNAELVGQAVAAKMSTWLPCSTSGDEAACGNKLVQDLGKLALRRPLLAAEAERYRNLVANARGAYGFKEAVAMTVSAFLQDPNFLYLLEKPPGGTGVDLAPYELASRLAYFLTDTLPDTELLAAAESGEITKPDRLEAQARRLLASTKAKTAINSFHEQWLHLEKVRAIDKRNKAFYPTFTASTKASLFDATNRYIDKLFWDETQGTYQALMTSDHAFVDSALAPLYGTTASGSGLNWTKVNGEQRAGLLTQAGILAGLSNENANSPTLRGLFVLESLLCSHIPSPPANANTTPVAPDLGKPTTTRYRMEEVHLADSSCKGCHQLIDGVGFAFENYDALGGYRTQEMGLPVNSKTKIEADVDIDGEYDGAVPLAKAISASADAQRCFSTQWLAYARGIATSDVDQCLAQRIVRRQPRGALSMRTMLLDVALSDEFRKRSLSSGQ